MAAVLVGIAEYHKRACRAWRPSHGMMSALGFEILFGSLTITGSLMAFGKLQGSITGTPITYQLPKRLQHRHVLRHAWRSSST